MNCCDVSPLSPVASQSSAAAAVFSRSDEFSESSPVTGSFVISVEYLLYE